MSVQEMSGRTSQYDIGKRVGAHRSVLALLAYVVMSIIFFGLPVVGSLSTVQIGQALSDPPSFVWYFAWWPHALTHRLNPFLTDAIWAPRGINLSWVTAIPGASLLAAPVTLLAGPVTAYNVVCLLALPLAAWSTYLLCYRVTGDVWASLAGGYVFGFSSYELGHLVAGHVNLILIFLIPLVPYLILCRLDGSIRANSFVLLLGVLLAAQLSFSTEIFASLTGLLLLNGGLALAVARVDTRRRLIALVPLVIIAYGFAALLSSPFLYYLAQGSTSGPIWTYKIYSSHLHNFIQPTPLTRLRPHLLYRIMGTHQDALLEDVAYFGAPLIVLIALFTLYFRRQRVGRFLSASLALVCVLALGPGIAIAGHRIPLPWLVIRHLPLANLAHPARLIVYAFLDVAVIVALWVKWTPWPRWATQSMVLVSVLFLLPNPSPTFWYARNSAPLFFGTGLYRRYLRRAETVLIIPNTDTMLWQAQTGMYFKMAQTGNIGPLTPRSALDVRREPILSTLESGVLIPDYRTHLRLFLSSHHVSTIVVVKNRADGWAQLLTSVGVPPVEAGGVLLYKVPQH